MNYQKLKYITLCWLLCMSLKSFATTPQLPVANPNSNKKFEFFLLMVGEYGVSYQLEFYRLLKSKRASLYVLYLIW